jgi:hypothetical protein
MIGVPGGGELVEVRKAAGTRLHISRGLDAGMLIRCQAGSGDGTTASNRDNGAPPALRAEPGVVSAPRIDLQPPSAGCFRLEYNSIQQNYLREQYDMSCLSYAYCVDSGAWKRWILINSPPLTILNRSAGHASILIQTVLTPYVVCR